jgi:hypothetical protein
MDGLCCTPVCVKQRPHTGSQHVKDERAATSLLSDTCDQAAPRVCCHACTMQNSFPSGSVMTVQVMPCSWWVSCSVYDA